MPARWKIDPLQRTEIPELSQFLINGLGAPASSSYFSHDVLSWKYFDGPGGASESSVCSLIARSAGKIIGHIGFCPRQFVQTGRETAPVSTLHAIDWLGSRDHSGSGAFLMLQAFGTSKTQYAVGGSAQAQAVFPRLGFEKKTNLAVYRKILAPFHRLRMKDQGLFRKWAGTAKDLVSILRTRTPKALHGVELRPVSQFSDEIDVLAQCSSPSSITSQRDHRLLNYILRYPRPGFSGWTIHDSGRLIGHAVLNVTPDRGIQLGKVVDCWLSSEDASCWQSVVVALIQQLRALSADVVTCYGTTPSLTQALQSSGFTKSGEKNVYVRDKEQLLPSNLPLALSMLEADHAIV